MNFIKNFKICFICLLIVTTIFLLMVSFRNHLKENNRDQYSVLIPNSSEISTRTSLKTTSKKQVNFTNMQNVPSLLSAEQINQIFNETDQFRPQPSHSSNFPNTVNYKRTNIFNTSGEPTNEHTFQFLITPQVPECQKQLTLLSLVIIAPHFFEKRKVIRRTWAASSSPHMKVVFVLGLYKNASSTVRNQVNEEASKYKDILLEDYLDDYFNSNL